MSDFTDSPAETVGGLVVLGGALLVTAVSPLNLVSETNLWPVAEPAPSWVLAGVAVAVAAQWFLGRSRARRGVSVLAILGSLGVWFIATVLSPEPRLSLHLSLGWAMGFAVYALFLGIGAIGIRTSASQWDGIRSRVATGLLVVGVLLVVFLSMDRIYVGPPNWVQLEFAGTTGLVFAIMAVGVAAEWLLAPHGWTRETSAVVGGAALMVYFVTVVVQTPAGGATTLAGWAGFTGSIAILLGGILTAMRRLARGVAVWRHIA